MTVSKSEAVRLFQHYDIESLPARLVSSKVEFDDLVSGEFKEFTMFNIRACSHAEQKNLPRIVCVQAAEAKKWLCANRDYPNYVVQPYDELLFSIELVVGNGHIFAEVVPGIWELDNNFSPALITFGIDDFCLDISIPLVPQFAKFWNYMSTTAERELRLVEDWQLAATADWIRKHHSALSELASKVQIPLGVKAHYSRMFGISPQNIHTDNVVVPPIDMPAGAPCGTPIITDVLEEIPKCDEVILLAAIAREEHKLLDGLMNKLSKAGVKSVYLKSGMLSHLAISLRENGFRVRRA